MYSANSSCLTSNEAVGEQAVGPGEHLLVAVVVFMLRWRLADVKAMHALSFDCTIGIVNVAVDEVGRNPRRGACGKRAVSG